MSVVSSGLRKTLSIDVIFYFYKLKTLATVKESMKVVKRAVKTNTVKQSLKGNIMKTVMTF